MNYPERPRYYVKSGRYCLMVVDRVAGKNVRTYGLRQYSGPDKSKQMSADAHAFCKSLNV